LRTKAEQQNARKDKNLHPLNSDFDLYSIGKDGESRQPLTAKWSRDDVVRANDGGFVGLASEYTH
jgi:general secretion pathway protein G